MLIVIENRDDNETVREVVRHHAPMVFVRPWSDTVKTAVGALSV